MDYFHTSAKGLTDKTVKEISHYKNEPAWMQEERFRAYQTFLRQPMPAWGPDLSKIDFNDLYYYLRPTGQTARSWSEVPEAIRHTYDRLGLPEAEKKYLGGVMAQYESDAVYHSVQKKLEKKGVIFTDMDTGLRRYPEIVRKYFSTVVPAGDNKFAALNTAVWSGGSLLYIPAGVKVEFPLQAYFRINAEKVGQFERTLIIAEPGSFVHYVEGCTAPVYSTGSLHAAVVEIIVKPGARVRYTTVQNWSKNVYNIVTKRAFVMEEGVMEWVDGNLGSKVTMKYPSVYLLGRKARGEVLSIAFAGSGQHQDAGGKAIHGAPETSSSIISKSVSRGSGRTSYRGLVRVAKGMAGCRSNVVCDALLMNKNSRSDTYPTMDIRESATRVSHEATVGRVGEEQLFYLMSRGLSEQEAMSMIISGFIEPIARQLPVEFAAELNKLIELEMGGRVG
ncbi:MAG: Fe-S cluster assembly protein SufB [Patescibacteria group bacterium]